VCSTRGGISAVASVTFAAQHTPRRRLCRRQCQTRAIGATDAISMPSMGVSGQGSSAVTTCTQQAQAQ
jgi:hypothetical protein